MILPPPRSTLFPYTTPSDLGFLWHIEQKLAAAQVNGSRPVPRTIDRLLAETRDRLILKSQLTPRLGAGLHRRALSNIIVHCGWTPCLPCSALFSALDDLSHLGFSELVRTDLDWEPN